MEYAWSARGVRMSVANVSSRRVTVIAGQRNAQQRTSRGSYGSRWRSNGEKGTEAILGR